MRVELFSLESGALDAGGCVVIIDVFRAFTTSAVAFDRGAKEIFLAQSVASALSLRDKGVGSICIGERNGARPVGFEHGNSPAEMRSANVQGKTLIQTTTNGTAGIFAARQATQVFAASFVCAEATVSAIRIANPAFVSLVAMGRRGMRADEDELCALYIRSRLEGRQPDKEAMRVLTSTIAPQPSAKLLKNGEYHEQDRDLALSISSIPVAMEVHKVDGLFVIRPVRFHGPGEN